MKPNVLAAGSLFLAIVATTLSIVAWTKLTKASSELRAVYTPSAPAIAQLETLEQKIADPTKWPASLDEADKLRSELKGLIDGLTPLVQDKLLPRLIPLRWAVQAVCTVRSNSPGEESKAEAAVEVYNSMLDSEPDRAPKAVHELLESTKGDAMQKAASFHSTSAINQARRALEDPKMNNESLVAVSSVLDGLEDKNGEIQKLQDQLRKKLVQADVEARTAEFNIQLKRLDTISDENLQLLGRVRLSEEANLFKLALKLDPTQSELSINDLDQVLAHSAAKLRGIFVEKTRSYQKWALTQIKTFNEEYEKIEKAKGSWQDVHFKRLIALMNEHLTPISAGQLDAPVNELYQKAWQRGWTKLEGRDDQHFFAEQAVVIEKVTPDALQRKPRNEN